MDIRDEIKEVTTLDIVNGFLLPVGFKELIEYLDTQKSKVVQSKDIQQELAKKYRFSSGKVAGTIKRAEEKGLLSKMGYGVYQYNAEKTKDYRISSLSQKDVVASKAISNTVDSVEKKEQTVLVKINEEIMETVKRINAIPASEMTSLSIEDFKKVKEKISALEKIAKQ